MRIIHVGLNLLKGRNKPWRLRWKPRNSEKPKTEWHLSKSDALGRKKEIEEFENGNRDLAVDFDYQEIRENQFKLKQTDNYRAKDKSITFAVDWFLENYQGGDEIHEIKFYYKEYQKIKAKIVSKHSIASDEQMIGTKGKEAFVNLHGKIKPTEITRKFLQNYLDSNGSIFHREKALRAFFNWMSGESKYHNDNPCLRKNPIKGVNSGKSKRNYKRAIASNQEVCDLLRLANTKEFNFSAARWAFMFFTGMRPNECERFWDPKLKLGWKSIALDHKEPFIIIDQRVIRKKGLPSRQIKIRKGFLEMLREFKKEGEVKYPMEVKNWKRVHSSMRKKIFSNRLKISTKMDEAKDIARHTFVSNLYLYSDSMAMVTAESGDNEQTIRNHYLNPLVSPKDAKNFFEKISVNSLNEKVKINHDEESSPLDNIVEKCGKEILSDPEFVKSYTGGKILFNPEKLSHEQKFQALQKYRNDLMHSRKNSF